MEEASKQNRQLRAPSEDYGDTEEPPSSYDGYVRMGIHICTQSTERGITTDLLDSGLYGALRRNE